MPTKRWPSPYAGGATTSTGSVGSAASAVRVAAAPDAPRPSPLLILEDIPEPPAAVRDPSAYEPPKDQVRLYKLLDAIYKAADDEKEIRG